MNRREERSLESIENLTNLQLYLRFWRLLLRRLVRHPLLPKNFPGAWWVLVIVCSPGVKRPPRVASISFSSPCLLIRNDFKQQGRTSLKIGRLVMSKCYAIGLSCSCPEGSGGGEIRTHEAFQPSGFQDRRNQPLCHPSGAIPVGNSLLQYSVTPSQIAYYGRPRIAGRNDMFM